MHKNGVELGLSVVLTEEVETVAEAMRRRRQSSG
jgi:hypothetical protein